MRHWLKRHNFSYKKPALVPGRANKEQQQQWLAEYEKLRQGLPEDETIGFIDGVHPTHNVQPAYGWIRTGVRKEIPANTGRERINLSGTLGQTLRGRVRDKFSPIGAPSANFEFSWVY